MIGAVDRLILDVIDDLNMRHLNEVLKVHMYVNTLP